MNIYGHDDEIGHFLETMRGSRPPHGWIFAGAHGVGKATLAKALAARLLAEAADPHLARSAEPLGGEHPTARLIAARSHPDYKLIEREVWAKPARPERLMPYADRKSEDLPSRSIRLIQIRWLIESMALSPSLSDRRIVVIDSADDLETGGANALLKMLEEPPASTVFILISHAPGALLPTIRSRCQTMRFSPLGDDAMAAALRKQLPDVDADEIAALIGVGKGSPGRAVAVAGLDLAGLSGSLTRLAATGDRDNRERSALAASLSGKAATKRYEAFLRLVPQFIAEAARARSGGPLGEAIGQWERARELAESAVPGSLDPHAVTLSLSAMVAALAPAGAAAKA